MLARFTTCGVGFIVAVGIFIALGALGRSQFREYVPQPAVRVLRSVPITVDMTLRIGLTKPVTKTITIGSTDPDAQEAGDGAAQDTSRTVEPEVTVQTNGDTGDGYLVDEMGIPYDVRIESEADIELEEWHASRDTSSDVTYSAAIKGDTVGERVTFDVTYYDDRGHTLSGVTDSSKSSVYNPISKQTLYEFKCEGCVDVVRDAEFYAIVIR
jgi:hypothetical protein